PRSGAPARDALAAERGYRGRRRPVGGSGPRAAQRGLTLYADLNVRCIPKRRENHAISLRRLDESLARRLIEGAFEIEGHHNAADTDGYALVDAERTARVPG